MLSTVNAVAVSSLGCASGETYAFGGFLEHWTDQELVAKLMRSVTGRTRKTIRAMGCRVTSQREPIIDFKQANVQHNYQIAFQYYYPLEEDNAGEDLLINHVAIVNEQILTLGARLNDNVDQIFSFSELEIIRTEAPDTVNHDEMLVGSQTLPATNRSTTF